MPGDEVFWGFIQEEGEAGWVAGDDVVPIAASVGGEGGVGGEVEAGGGLLYSEDDCGRGDGGLAG